MKRVHRSLLIGSSILVLPQLASASLLLAGWHDFDASTAPEYLDQNTTGFSGTVTKGGVPSYNYIGSKDGDYGGVDPDGDSNTVPGAAEDGSLVLQPNLVTGGVKYLVFSITNRTGDNYVLQALEFDAANTTATATTGKVQYRIDGGSYQDLATKYQRNVNGYTITGPNYSPTIKAASGTGSPFVDVATTDRINSADFIDFDFLLGFHLNNNSTVDFKFTLVGTTGAEQRIDNVLATGLVIVPESGSLLALGCLVGSGAFLRARRRGARS